MSQTNISTYFTTQIGTTQLLYNADKEWVTLILRLETAGPVVIGEKQNLVPVLAGKGRLLPTDDDVEFILPKGQRLYIAASAVNRVAFTVEPLPLLQQILYVLEHGFGGVIDALFGRKPKPLDVAEPTVVKTPASPGGPGTGILPDWGKLIRRR
jgi:hypothetical protein